MPETSPELAARIDSLRASHAENPARFFMPLASALREAGEPGKAEELLRENLKRHPGYLSAHVLLGRCLADRGAYAEARNEFQYVLSVDPQNLIALRTLGDMSATGGDPAEARRWYGELLSVDPMNTEARQAMAAIDAAPQAAPAAPSASPPAAEQDGFGMVEIDSGVSHQADHPAAHADPGSWGELSLDEPALASPAPEAAPDSPAEEFEALDFGAVDLDAASASGAADEPPAGEAAPAAGGFDAWGSVDDGQVDIDTSSVEPVPLEQFYDEPEAEAAAEPAPHADDHDEHGEVVTETIAELYARQGFPERAAGVYRELIARRGQEPALVRRLEELEREMSAASAAPAGEDAEDLGAIDLPLMVDDEPAAAPVDEQPASTSWLETVDAVVAGTAAADVGSGFDVEDATADAGLPMLDLPGDDVPAHDEAPQSAFAAAASTGDAFADSFTNGFDGGDGARQEWEAPRVEESEAVPELASAAAFASTLEEEPAAEPSPAASTVEETPAAEPSAAIEPAVESVEEPAHGGHTIVAYLAGILSWRPGAAASPSPEAPASPAAETSPAAPVADEAPPAERPWDEATLGAAVEQPPMDEPWIAGPASAEASPAGGDAWTAEPVANADEGAADADEPWAAPADDDAVSDELEPWGMMPEQVPPGVDPSPEAAADEPWAADDAQEAAEQPEDLPWLGTGADEPAAGTEPAAPAQPSAGEEPMPWEAAPFELSPEVPQEAAAERPAPRQEPTVEPAGGFSFEDFFAERPADAAPEAASVPEPLPPPPAPAASAPPAQPAAPQPQGGGEEDEDLESFQAWLQSLKR